MKKLQSMDGREYQKVVIIALDPEQQENVLCQNCGKSLFVLGNEVFNCPHCGFSKGWVMDARAIGPLEITEEKLENK